MLLVSVSAVACPVFVLHLVSLALVDYGSL